MVMKRSVSMQENLGSPINHGIGREVVRQQPYLSMLVSKSVSILELPNSDTFIGSPFMRNILFLPIGRVFCKADTSNSVEGILPLEPCATSSFTNDGLSLLTLMHNNLISSNHVQ